MNRTDPLQVWDLPVRLFHWSVVVLVTLSWVAVENGYMKVHLWSGLVLLTLLLFRLTWGFIGSTTARFADFARAPRHAVAYLRSLGRGEHPKHLGHNPAGGWMVVLLLAALLTQAVTGLFANDGVRFNGPLATLVSSGLSDRLTRLHGLVFNVILLLVWMHIVAVLYYRCVRGENLIAAMITGKRARGEMAPHGQLQFVRHRWALLSLAIAAALVWWIATPPS
ncbi:MAG: cytochrome b/b6 domain-containing protein [Steroidobacteraceae bacterium]